MRKFYTFLLAIQTSTFRPHDRRARCFGVRSFMHQVAAKQGIQLVETEINVVDVSEVKHEF